MDVMDESDDGSMNCCQYVCLIDCLLVCSFVVNCLAACDVMKLMGQTQSEIASLIVCCEVSMSFIRFC